MTIFLIIIILLLLVYIIFQELAQRSRNKIILQIKNQLELKKENDSNEVVMVLTNDKEITEMLISLNKVLETKREDTVKFRRMELSMKRMLANVSHDLKTPLTVISGYMEMLQQQENISLSEQKRIINQVNEKTTEMTELVNKFFDLAKLESGDKDIPLTKVDISEICRKNILLFHDLIDSKGLEVFIGIPEKPVYALGNIEALNRVLSNLISNALKYGAAGNVIGLNLTEDDSTVSIEIYDKGTGINEIEQYKVFERMYTLEESRNKEFQGSGLGLTITKKLMEEMQGSIMVYSTAFEKTSFICTLKKYKI